MNENLSSLETQLGFAFKNKNILKQALVHRSYINEHQGRDLDHNERLEFLGDAVLELVVTEYLYRQYKNPEGELTNWRASLVNSQMLAEVSQQLQVSDYLYLSRGESKDESSKARNGILANAFEAIVGAIYLDQGMEPAASFIERVLLARLPYILKNKLYQDPKSRFQEASQEKVGITPTYNVIEEKGPDHDKYFRVGVCLGNERIAEGEGGSKQEAQVAAAAAALKAKNW